MWDVDAAELPIKDRSGRTWGTVLIELLPDTPSTGAPPLLDRRGDPELEPGMAGVQLLEGCEYRYEIQLEPDVPPGNITTDRPEIFRRDKVHGRTGRIRTGLYTGTLPVTLRAGDHLLGSFELEVRARKLDYLSHYRWMLRDLADVFAEVVMRRFAPTEAYFSPRWDLDAPTLYQRFAFLKSIIEDDTLDGAISQILSSPHREWREEHELRRTGHSIPSGPTVARAIARGGQRVPWRAGGGTALESLPVQMPVDRYFETYDTIPNRFVKHVLAHWRNTAADVASALSGAAGGAPVQRGIAEANSLLARLDETLAQPFFREVSPLTQIPAGNQVLQKRAGYRDVYGLFVQSELAALLAWPGGEDVYRAGQKDVATLYEYWVFVQLGRIVSELCDEPLDMERLLEPGGDGLDLQLKRGAQRVLQGRVNRFGRTLELELWYNKTFSPGALGESWTLRLRPDCSLKIQVAGYGEAEDAIWLHFDAKYRADTLLELFGGDGENGEAETERATDPGMKPVPDDLLKMHAYRDAIRRSPGAYVIYPGNDEQVLRRYHEILPGLGAFALRPTSTGEPDGQEAIRRFIADVLEHASTQVSQHERYRYWKAEIFRRPPPSEGKTTAPAVRFLTRPPADTRVLLGFVRDEQHFGWIRRTGLYNMRADDRTGSVGLGSQQLAAEIVVLYGPALPQSALWRVAGDPLLLTKKHMVELGYPNPRSSAYYCLPLEPVTQDTELLRALTHEFVAGVVREIAPDSAYGAPVAATWARLVELITQHGVLAT